jgi:hypothetical protein
MFQEVTQGLAWPNTHGAPTLLQLTVEGRPPRHLARRVNHRPAARPPPRVALPVARNTGEQRWREGRARARGGELEAGAGGRGTRAHAAQPRVSLPWCAASPKSRLGRLNCRKGANIEAPGTCARQNFEFQVFRFEVLRAKVICHTRAFSAKRRGSAFKEGAGREEKRKDGRGGGGMRSPAGHEGANGIVELLLAEGAARLGIGRTVALHHRSSTS